MRDIVITSVQRAVQDFRRNQALWLYLLIFLAAITMSFFSALAQAR